jgi:hypothetical protein
MNFLIIENNINYAFSKIVNKLNTVFNKNRFNLYLIVLFLGVYVHTYFIPLGRTGLKFFYFVLLMHLLEFLYKNLKLKITLTLFDYFMILTLIYSMIMYLFVPNQEQHAISMIYLTNIVLVSRFLITKFDYFTSKENLIYKIHILIFGIGVLLFFYNIFFIGLETVFIERAFEEERREMANKISTVVFYMGAMPRYTGYYVDPNFWGLHLTFALYLLFLIKMKTDNTNYKLFILAISIIFLSIILVLSRGGYVALLVAFFVFNIMAFLFNVLSKKEIKIFAILTFIIFVLVNSIYLFQDTYGIDLDYLFSKFDSQNLEENSRFTKWEVYWNNIVNSDYLYTGFGISNSVAYFTTYSCHNNYVYLLYNFGLIWIVFFFLILIYMSIYLIKKIKSVPKQNKRYFILSLSFFIAILVQSLMIDVFFTIPFWANIFLTYKVMKEKVF